MLSRATDYRVLHNIGDVRSAHNFVDFLSLLCYNDTEVHQLESTIENTLATMSHHCPMQVALIDYKTNNCGFVCSIAAALSYANGMVTISACKWCRSGG